MTVTKRELHREVSEWRERCQAYKNERDDFKDRLRVANECIDDMHESLRLAQIESKHFECQNAKLKLKIAKRRVRDLTPPLANGPAQLGHVRVDSDTGMLNVWDGQSWSRVVINLSGPHDDNHGSIVIDEGSE